jgi:hypothetical protein
MSLWLVFRLDGVRRTANAGRVVGCKKFDAAGTCFCGSALVRDRKLAARAAIRLSRTSALPQRAKESSFTGEISVKREGCRATPAT